MAKMAAEPLFVWAARRNAPHTPKWEASRRCRLQSHRLFSTIRASQPVDDKSKFYKELGMFTLRKKIEDSVNRAEMLAPTALELEEASCIKQEEMIREYNLWADLVKSNDILVKLADSAKVVDALKDLSYKAEEAKLITELAEMDVINYVLFKQAYTASQDVSKFLDKYEMSKLLNGPYDIEGACIIIEAGSEDIHSEIWAEQVVGMYMKWAGKQGYGGRIVEKSPSKSGGVKSAIIEFESKYAYGYLSGERGIHRMISSHNGSVFSEASLAAVDVIPLFLEAAPDLFIDDKDLEISFISSCEEEHGRRGPSVHIQHVPTGIRVQSSGERNHFANNMKALNRLRAKLLLILRDQGISSVTSIKKDDIVNMLDDETRRYLFHPYKLVHDVRTGIQLPDLNSVLDGNIELFISANVNNRQACYTV